MTDTLPEFLLHWAERTPDAVFVAEPDRGRVYTYGQVAGFLARFHNTGYNDGLAHMLLAHGRVDVPRRFDPPAIARALAEGRYSFLIGVPSPSTPPA